MAVSITDILAIIKALVTDTEKLNKFKEIIADLKELISDIKDLVRA